MTHLCRLEMFIQGKRSNGLSRFCAIIGFPPFGTDIQRLSHWVRTWYLHLHKLAFYAYGPVHQGTQRPWCVARSMKRSASSEWEEKLRPCPRTSIYSNSKKGTFWMRIVCKLLHLIAPFQISFFLLDETFDSLSLEILLSQYIFCLMTAISF